MLGVTLTIHRFGGGSPTAEEMPTDEETVTLQDERGRDGGQDVVYYTCDVIDWERALSELKENAVKEILSILSI